MGTTRSALFSKTVAKVSLTCLIITSIQLHADQSEVASLIKDYQQSAIERGDTPSASALVDYFRDHNHEDKIPLGFSQNDSNLEEVELDLPDIYLDPDYIEVADKLAADDPDGRILTDHAKRVTALDVEKNYEYGTSVSIAPKGGRYQASGVLIYGGHVLTAGHIWDGSTENAPDRVWIGRTTNDNDEDLQADGLELRVQRLVRHPNYRAIHHSNGSQSPRANDLMILELDAQSKEKIRYHAKLLEPTHVSKLGKEPWLTMRIVGFGYNRKSAFSWRGMGVQRIGSLPIVINSTPELYGLNSIRYNGLDVVSEFAAPAALDYADTCNGDSGAPGFVADGGELLVAAIVSRRIPGNGPKCGRGGIYTIIPYYKDWIDYMCKDKSTWTPVK